VSAAPAGADGRRRIWHPVQRLMHWSLAACTIAAFATHEGGGHWHEWLGYGSLGLALLRIALAVALKAPFWRLDRCTRDMASTWAYAMAVWRHHEPRFLGHNPLGAWMVWVLLGNAVLTGFTGWLFTTDAFWGYAWLEELHGFLGESFVPLVLLHLAGVAFTSWRHRESLVGAMVHGHKRVRGNEADGLD
jgi:cytochrome b